MTGTPVGSKTVFTGEGYAEMDIPWQLCRTVGPLTLHSQEIRQLYLNSVIHHQDSGFDPGTHAGWGEHKHNIDQPPLLDPRKIFGTFYWTL